MKRRRKYVKANRPSKRQKEVTKVISMLNKAIPSQTFTTAGSLSRQGASEMKNFDRVLPLAGPITHAPNGTILCDTYRITQGTGPNQRLGRKIILKSLYFKILIRLPSIDYDRLTAAAAIKANNIVTMFVVMDTQANGALPVFQDIFKSNVSNTDDNSGYIALRNLNNNTRFKILHEHTFNMQYQSSSIQTAVGTQVGDGDGSVVTTTATEMHYQGTNQVHKKYIKLDLPITYKSNGGVIGDISENNLFIWMVQAYQGRCSYKINSRLRYTDV